MRNQADGTLDLAEVAASIRAENEHFPITRLVCVENTHNRCGGRVISAEYMDAIGELAHSRGLKLHVDGARLWNAAVAQNVPPERLVRYADSVTVCLSKALAAPVGSVIAGSGEFIRRARRNRKVVGGGMRQAGILAAAGIVAVTEMVERLADDHANAKRLANGLAGIDGIKVDPEGVETNMVFFDVARDTMSAADLSVALKRRNVWINATSDRSLRAVLHYEISAGEVDEAVEAVRAVMARG